MNYYNEFDEGAANWLESLIERGLIPPGHVDRRSIVDVRGEDLHGYTQCHFFAGIGGWSYALQLAGWPTDEPVWTGSCPCQPFSAAGQRRGFADERHLWPAFLCLISKCRPEYVFGEQVAGKAGEQWFDVVQNDLANQDYTSGMSVLAACSVGAPHIRKRLFWVAHTASARREEVHELLRKDAGGRHKDALPDAVGRGPLNGFWRGADWVRCREGKWRPVEPGTFPLANGIPKRVGQQQLKGYGNAIVPQVAAAFVEACIYEI